MSVSVKAPIERFPRRVSFNNLDPEPVSAAREVDFSDYNLGYGSSVVNDISKIYSSSYSRIRKRRRSAAPAKPILKNKLSPQQLRYNISNAATLGINYHQDLDELESSDDEPCEQEARKQPATRRKSYSDMTDEELMALDPQFANTKSNLDKFKFDSVSTYYRPERRLSTVAPVAAASLELPDSHNYKGISLTRQHEKFVDRRTLLTVVSGRKHTWNSIDWLAKSDFLENGDFLIVSALVPAKYSSKPDMLHKRCERLLDYVVESLTKELSLKITVEFVVHEAPGNGNKTMLKNLFLYYSPHVVILGNKSTSLNFKYPIKMKESTVGNFLIKFLSYLIKYSTVPVILVGNNTSVVPLSSTRKGSYVSEMESIASSASLSCKPVDYTSLDVYQAMVLQVSEKSLDQSREYLKQLKRHQERQSSNDSNNSTNLTIPQIKFDDSVTFDSKIHSIYNSQLGKSTSGNSERMYKVRSLFESDKSEKLVQSQSSDTVSLDKVASGEKLTLKQIKSSLKKEPVKKAPEKKKSLWKKIF